MTQESNPGESTRPECDERILPSVARASIAHGLSHDTAITVDLSNYGGVLVRPGASFVTLKLDSDLRGCVGSAEAYQPLVRDVAGNAQAAAFADNRFSPLSPVEFDRLELSISILGPLSPIDVASEADLIERLIPGQDGLVLSDQGRRGLFLPQVWEMLADPVDFVTHLKLKAGFKRSHWSSTMVAQRFRVHTINEVSN